MVVRASFRFKTISGECINRYYGEAKKEERDRETERETETKEFRARHATYSVAYTQARGIR